MHKVELVGIEIEGAFDYDRSYDGDLREDGSVSVCGSSSQDECYCFENCECEECILCDLCDDQVSSCSCDGCLMCESCNNQYEDCDCDRMKLSECEDKECEDNNLCENCQEDFDLCQELTHNCSEMDHTYTNCERDCDCDCECRSDEGLNDGEIVSDKLKPDQVSEWIKDNYCGQSNRSCGIHVHLSFNDELSYMMVMDKKYFNSFKENLIDFGQKIGIPKDTEHEFYDRLNGKESYCSLGYIPLSQVHIFPNYEGDRYSMINYGYSNHRKTIEIRILPTFHNSRYAILCVDEFIRFTNEYLMKQKDPDLVKFEYNLNDDMLKEIKN